MKKILFLVFLYCSSEAQPCITNTSSLLFRNTIPSPNDHVSFNTGNGLVITDSITVEAWINASVWATTPAQGTILCKHSWNFGEQGYVFRAGGNGQLSFALAGDSMGLPTSWKDLISTNLLTINTWYHVAGTFDGDSLKLYINGNQVASMFFHGRIIPSNAYPPAIGMLSDQMWSSSGGRYWKGKIDEVRVWHRALSQSDLLANMNHHLDTTNQVGLAGYWRFNENTGTITDDMSSNNNNGTLSSIAQWTTVIPFGGGPPKPTISFSSPNLVCDSTVFAYQWFLYNNPILNATQQTYQATQTGVYFVQVSDPNGCTTMSDPYGFIGVSELSANSPVTFNYESTQSNITFIVQAQSTINEIALADMTGRVIISERLQTSEAKLTINKPVSGLYLININSDTGRYVRKIWIGK